MKVLRFAGLGLLAFGLATSNAARGEEKPAILRRVEMAATPAEAATIATDHARLARSALAARSGQELSPMRISVAAESLRDANVALALAISGLGKADTISATEAEKLLKAIALYNYNAEKSQKIPFFLTESALNAAEHKELEEDVKKGRASREQLLQEITAINEKTFAVTGGEPTRFQWSTKLPIIALNPPKPKPAKSPLLQAYRELVRETVGMHWGRLTRTSPDILKTGEVEISVMIAPDGSVSDFKTLRNTSDDAYLALCVASIREAEIPPIPKDLVEVLPGGRLEYVFTFAIK